MIKIPIFCTAIILSLTTAAQSILFNEVCPSNNFVVSDENGEFDDWFELYNNGNTPIDLNGFYLTDDISNPTKHLITNTNPLTQGDFILFWCDNTPQQGPYHCNFSISSLENIYLLNNNLEVVISLSIPSFPSDYSFGKGENGDWFYYDAPTPGQINDAEGFFGVATSPQFSDNPLFLENPQILSLSAPANFTIKYTTDGSTPTLNSTSYSTPLEINTEGIIKARCFAPGQIPSPTASKSFLAADAYQTPILSLSADAEEFLGTEGIYNNPYNGQEVAGHIEYFESDGSPIFSQGIGIKIHAPDNRSKKSLRLYARSEYGANRIDYPLFGEEWPDSFKRIVLRNAGNDGSDINKSGLRDALISTLYQSMDPGHGSAGYAPVQVFLNGAYHGMYNMRERQDTYYVEDHFGVLPNEMDFLERTAEAPNTRRVWSGNWDAFDDLEQLAISTDLSDGDAYAQVADQIDLRNFIDYQFLESYINNQDWLSNNMKFMKAYSPGSKWRWMLWDTDWGMGMWQPSYPHGFADWIGLGFALSDWGGWNSTVNTELLQNLVENDQFLEQFAVRGADLLNWHLKPEKIASTLAEISDAKAADMMKELERWNGNINTYNNQLNIINTFAENRPDFIRQEFIDYFDIGPTHEIDINAIPEDGGRIAVNSLSITSFPWQGIYYQAYPVQLTAIPSSGYTFVSWEDGSTNPQRSVTLENATTVTANFEPFSNETIPLVINEINYQNGTAEDWIELYNPTAESANLEGYSFVDSGNSFALPKTTIAPGGFLILARNSTAFEAVYDVDVSVIGNFDFGLSAAGEMLRLYNPDGQIIDEVPYNNSDQWPTPGPGQSIELNVLETENQLGENWFTRASANGSPGLLNDNTENIASLEYIGLELLAYPNPSSFSFVVKFENDEPIESLVLSNPMGQEVARYGQEGIGMPKLVLNWKNMRLNPGMYIVRAQSNGRAYATRIILQ